MSAPAANALSPAPRSTTQRKPESADNSPIAMPSFSHIGLLSALSLSGLLSATVAMTPSRVTRTGSLMAELAQRSCPTRHHLVEFAPSERNQRPEQEQERERGDRADERIRPEHAHVSARSDHQQPKG